MREFVSQPWVASFELVEPWGYVPTRSPQQRRDSPVAVTAILRGQRDDRSGQRILIDPLDSLIALCPGPNVFSARALPTTSGLAP